MNSNERLGKRAGHKVDYRSNLGEVAEPRSCSLDNSAGITLIELLVVMVIIAMFATLVGARLFKSVDKAKQTQAKSQIHEFEGVLGMFRLDVGRYPTTQEGLQALRVKPAGAANWDGPYLTKE